MNQWLIIAVIIVFIGFWLLKCVKQVGTTDTPAQAVKTRFAKPDKAVPSGLCFILWPIERLKLFPTSLYKLTYLILKGLYSKKSEEMSSQRMEVKIGVYFRWPRVDREYSFPISEEEAEKTILPDEQPVTRGLKKGFVWGRILGKELLLKAYYRIPVMNLMKVDIEELGKFFENTVIGAARHQMSERTSKECKEKQPKIEEQIKNHLLSEEGNPFFELGIPKECLDIELLSVKFPDETEKAWEKPEIKAREAEAAESEKKAISLRLEAFIEKGVPKEIAGLIVGGVEGQAMTIEQLRDLKILEKIGNL